MNRPKNLTSTVNMAPLHQRNESLGGNSASPWMIGGGLQHPELIIHNDNAQTKVSPQRRRSSSGGGAAAPTSMPSAEKSYLKSRRAQARNERRSNIMDMLNRNLENFPANPPPSPTPRKMRTVSPGRYSVGNSNNNNNNNSESSIQHKPTSTTTTATNSSLDSSSSSSPAVQQKSNLPPQRRMNLMNFFRKGKGPNDSSSSSANAGGGSVFSGSNKNTPATGRGNNLRRRSRSRGKERKDSLTASVTGDGDSSKLCGPEGQQPLQQEKLIQKVMHSYPKSQCRTMADHKEMALAELTRHSSNLHMTPEKMAQLILQLERRLKVKLVTTINPGEEDESIAESYVIDQSQSGRQSHSAHNSNIAAARNNSQRRSRDASTGRSRTPTRFNGSNRRTRTVVPSPDEPDMDDSSRRQATQRRQSSLSDESRRKEDEAPLFTIKSSTKSLDDRHPGSSKAISNTPPPPPSPGKSLSKRRSSLSRTGTLSQSNTRKDSDTNAGNEGNSSTVVERNSTEETKPMKPSKRYVEDLLLMDTSGHVGMYSGTISEKTGKPHGHGNMLYQTDTPEKGRSYEGEWNQGQWNGKGKHIKHNGDIYEGEFCDDQKHGLGVYHYHDGKRRFDGRYVMGHRVEGTMFYSDKSIYKGQWYSGKRQGRGIYQFSDKSRYKGEFDRDRIHGVGTLLWPDGSKYVGEWSEGQRHGKGKEYTRDGKIRYDGMWKQNKPVED